VGKGLVTRERESWLDGAPPPLWVRALPFVLLLGLCVATVAAPRRLDIGFLLAAIPPLAVLSYGPLATGVLGALVVAVLLSPMFRLDEPGSADLLTVLFIAALSVVVAHLLSHREAQLLTERTVAEAAQRAVVPLPPPRVGPVAVAGLYRAAQSGTLVGGDFFDIRPGPRGVRVVMGDVQGHGLSAVATVASLLGAFREGVLDDPGPEALAARLDRRLAVDSADTPHAELFATAAVLEFAEDASAVRIVLCGHPRPLLLRDGEVRELEVPADLPLGVGLAPAGQSAAVPVALRPGDRLFLASDGVSEARGPDGAFYPLAERLSAFGDLDPADLVESVWRDLTARCGKVGDDVTMLVLSPVGPAADSGGVSGRDATGGRREAASGRREPSGSRPAERGRSRAEGPGRSRAEEPGKGAGPAAHGGAEESVGGGADG
jgi:hypothetical protein